MKKVLGFVAALLTVITVSAIDNSYQGSNNGYDVRNYTCSELNSILATQGSARIIYQSFFGGNAIHYASPDMCRSFYEPIRGNVTAQDGFCRLGYKCRRCGNPAGDDDDSDCSDDDD